MNKKIKLSTIEIIVLLLSFIQLSIIPDKIFLFYRYIVIIIFAFRYHKEIIENRMISLLWLLYTVILSYSTWMNTQSVTWVMSAFMLGMQYIILFCTFYGFVNKRNSEELIQILIMFFLVMLIANDALLPIKSYNFSNPDEQYLLGNKFLVSYYHCLFGALIYTKYKKTLKKNIAILFLCYAVLIASIVHCTTGIIVAITIISMVYLPGLVKKLTECPIAFIALLIAENILIWGSTALFTNPFIVNIVTNVFHKSTDMTGRAKLYAVTIDLVEKKPLWGYGHLTDVYRNMFGYGNAQNGLFHIVTQAGIIGAIVYFGAIFVGLRKGDDSHDTYGLIMYVYAMLVGSAVEINLSSQFIIAIALIYAINSGKVKKKKKTIRKVVIR